MGNKRSKPALEAMKVDVRYFRKIRLGWLGTSGRDRTLCRQRGRCLAEMFLLPEGAYAVCQRISGTFGSMRAIRTKESVFAGANMKLPISGSSE